MSKLRFLLLAYILLLLVMFILPFYSSEGYLILRNTTSHLGAQNSPNAWIMNVVFLLLGICCIIESWRYLKDYWFHKILLTLFGIGLMLVAVFQHAPIIEGIAFNTFEDRLHSVFASLVGFSFTMFAFSAAFIEASNQRKALAFLLGISSMGLSMLMFGAPDFMGLWQRMMFILSFGWLIYFFECRRREERSL